MCLKLYSDCLSRGFSPGLRALGKAVRSYRLTVLKPVKGKGITKHAFYHTFSCLEGVIRTALDCFVVTSHSSAYCKRNDSQLANNLIDLSARE